MDKQHAVRLEVFDIVLGALYMTILVIEIFGLVSAFMVCASVTDHSAAAAHSNPSYHH